MNNVFMIVGYIDRIFDWKRITIRVDSYEDNGQYDYIDVVIPNEMEKVKEYIEKGVLIAVKGVLERKQLSGGVCLKATKVSFLANKNGGVK